MHGEPLCFWEFVMANSGAKGSVVHQNFGQEQPVFPTGLSLALSSVPGLFALAIDKDDTILEATGPAREIFALGKNDGLRHLIELCRSDGRAELAPAISKARSKPGTAVSFDCQLGVGLANIRYLSGQAFQELASDGAPGDC